MPKVIVSDTSILILLDKIGELDLLNKVYGAIVITPEIASEFGEILPDWIKIEHVKDLKFQEFLSTLVDPGEASALALASEKESALLLLDDLKARKLAMKLNLKITGTLGIIHKAKELGVLNNIKPLIDKLLMTNFRIEKSIIDNLLLRNKEEI